MKRGLLHLQHAATRLKLKRAVALSVSVVDLLYVVFGCCYAVGGAYAGAEEGDTLIFCVLVTSRWRKVG